MGIKKGAEMNGSGPIFIRNIFSIVAISKHAKCCCIENKSGEEVFFLGKEIKRRCIVLSKMAFSFRMIPAIGRHQRR